MYEALDEGLINGRGAYWEIPKSGVFLKGRSC